MVSYTNQYGKAIQFSFYLPEGEAKRLVEKAKSESRSISSFLRLELKKLLEDTSSK